MPTNKVNITSELIMLGDLNEDNVWDNKDHVELETFIQYPFNVSDGFVMKVDVNQNGSIDEEDLFILNALFEHSDPYATEEYIINSGKAFPKPRELYKYFPTNEYVQRPVYLLKHSVSENSPLKVMLDSVISDSGIYETKLRNEIYDEALRFSFRYEERKNSLSEAEKEYVDGKIAQCLSLYQAGDLYGTLLNLISLVEDAETLSMNNQTEFVQEILYFREHLRELLVSPLYTEFVVGNVDYTVILDKIESDLQHDLSLDIELATLEPPRDLSKIENYFERAEWQYYKSKTKKEDFEKLVLFAQYDRRYLRSVSNTTPKHQDLQVKNHNLPMILLYREALEIMNGDRKSAIGMLDETIRIPLGWVRSIPEDMLPTSIAFENFLLPGNKEDGADKSRHWNVFGGISLYESPKESLVLSFRREIEDLKYNEYTVEAMNEFIRDIIVNINGIYYVQSIDIN
ncbi:hypothetical protein KKG38_01790 [Patescibacteria group bacterium]|nr:hypothetical protein [Patescibacteria group bacterium]